MQILRNQTFGRLLAMFHRLLVAVLFTGFLHAVAGASGVGTIPFVDGRWRGDIETGPNSLDFQECWASTTFDDGVDFHPELSQLGA